MSESVTGGWENDVGPDAHVAATSDPTHPAPLPSDGQPTAAVGDPAGDTPAVDEAPARGAEPPEGVLADDNYDRNAQQAAPSNAEGPLNPNNAAWPPVAGRRRPFSLGDIFRPKGASAHATKQTEPFREDNDLDPEATLKGFFTLRPLAADQPGPATGSSPAVPASEAGAGAPAPPPAAPARPGRPPPRAPRDEAAARAA
ncbi:hypothetical protein I6A84_44165, partial [Frankia sp. CNm7]